MDDYQSKCFNINPFDPFPSLHVPRLVVDVTRAVRHIILEVALVGDAAIAVENGALATLPALPVLPLVTQAIFELVFPVAMLLSFVELPLVNSTWLL